MSVSVAARVEAAARAWGRLRPPVSPWWMYRWLRDWAPDRGRLRAALYTLPCWWALWRWAASPHAYAGDYIDGRSGGRAHG